MDLVFLNKWHSYVVPGPFLDVNLKTSPLDDSGFIRLISLLTLFFCTLHTGWLMQWFE